MTAQLLGPGSRKERKDRALGVETPPEAECLSIRLRRRRLQERMSDEGGVCPGAYQGLRLERKNQRQPVGVSCQFFCAAGAPGPDLRCDIVEDRQLTPAGGLRRPPLAMAAPWRERWRIIERRRGNARPLAEDRVACLRLPSRVGARLQPGARPFGSTCPHETADDSNPRDRQSKTAAKIAVTRSGEPPAYAQKAITHAQPTDLAGRQRSRNWLPGYAAVWCSSF